MKYYVGIMLIMGNIAAGLFSSLVAYNCCNKDVTCMSDRELNAYRAGLRIAVDPYIQWLRYIEGPVGPFSLETDRCRCTYAEGSCDLYSCEKGAYTYMNMQL